MSQPVTFLDGPEDVPYPPSGGANAKESGDPRRDYVAAALWVLAAAGCVLAAASDLYRFEYLDPMASRGGYDATGHPLQSSLPGDQGPRWAIALWAVAAVLAALALASANAAGRPVRPRWLGPAAIGAPALLAGVLLGIGLFLDSSLAISTAIAQLYSERVDQQVGACIWFGGASFVLAVAAALVSSRARLPARLRVRAPRHRPSVAHPRESEPDVGSTNADDDPSTGSSRLL